MELNIRTPGERFARGSQLKSMQSNLKLKARKSQLGAQAKVQTAGLPRDKEELSEREEQAAPSTPVPQAGEAGGRSSGSGRAGDVVQGQGDKAAGRGVPLEPPLTKNDPLWRLHEPPDQVDDLDKGTPDEWIKRNPELIRLTSKHPLNAEPPLRVLMECGFVTLTSLHYVRNHGAVPHIKWEEHRLTVRGLVEQETTFTMDHLFTTIPHHTVLCTVACAGNRRKEIQLVKRTEGFAWGQAAVGTSYWTGVALRDVLARCGILGPREGARFVRFRGPLGELPKGDSTHAPRGYGTSIPAWKALDPLSEVILAFQQNGRLLTPDHGFPLRVIIPGYIGGRMVKWLEEIEVSSEESDNWYHRKDNKVLPADVDQERANRENWWPRPEYVAYNLNINSVIGAPLHGEELKLPTDGQGTYTLRGFAHTGSGHQVIRVEVSLDGAATWRQAATTQREDRHPTDIHWCWVLWELPVPVGDLEGAAEVRCRAWDDTQNTQPKELSWNLIGMMNNAHYVVKVRRVQREEGQAGEVLRFLHPTNVESRGGPLGWMEEEKQAGGESAESREERQEMELQGKAWAQLKTFSWDEIRQHNSRESCWFVRDGKVYDATAFLEQHPGGAAAIVGYAGQDASKEFDPIHSSDARKMTVQYLIGKLEGAEEPQQAPAAAAGDGVQMPQAQDGAGVGESAEQEEHPPALQGKKAIKVRLAEKQEVSHDTRRFCFELPSPQHRLGLPVGHHITVTAQIKGETVVRPYTPVTLDNELGHFDLVIKVYRAGEDPKHPEGGKMSQHMDSLAIGDRIDVRGPYGEFTYLGSGSFMFKGREGHCRRINLLGGGTGITPLYQVMKAVFEDPDDPTEMCLLFANKTEQDILLREQLEEAAQKYPNRVRVEYTVDNGAPEGWRHERDHISKEMIQAHMFERDPETIALVCGPPPMVEKAVVPALQALGFHEEHTIVF